LVFVVALNVFLKSLKELCVVIFNTRREAKQMQLVGVLLFLISVGTVVGPIGAVAVMNHNDLTQLVISPDVKSLISGDNNILPDNNQNGNNGDNGNGGDNSGGMGLLTPQFVNVQIDQVQKTFSLVVDVTNNFKYDLTLNQLTANVQNAADNQMLGSITLGNSVSITVGQTSEATVLGTWTSEAETLVTSGASSVDINLINLTLDVNGLIIQLTEPQHVGNIPLSIP
jgi:hypothetical protein